MISDAQAALAGLTHGLLPRLEHGGGHVPGDPLGVEHEHAQPHAHPVTGP